MGSCLRALGISNQNSENHEGEWHINKNWII